MQKFYAVFFGFIPSTKPKKGRKKTPDRETAFWCYEVPAEDYHHAVLSVAPVYDWLMDSEKVQNLSLWEVKDAPNTRFADAPYGYNPLPELGAEYEDRYYDSRYDYELMIIEPYRLLGLNGNDEENNGYGAYVRNIQTGESTFAAPHGRFYTHDEVQAGIKRASQGNFRPTDSFRWEPILFPCRVADGVKTVSIAHYVTSSFQLAFPISYWGHEAYDKQAQWIAAQEGIGT